jgi:hypothetical protein
VEVIDGSARTRMFRFSKPDDVFQLRVSLQDVEPPIWRRLLVPQDILLPRLHRILQAAMGWKDYHLHQFLVGEVRFAEPDNEYLPGPIDYRSITLNQIALRTGATCVYEYDFGDSWEHLIEVEDELPVESVITPLPHCVAGERACPPEDAGGPPGYERLLEALRDPSDEEHDHLRRWAGSSFDAEAFDVDAVNRRLARYRPRVGGPARSRSARRPTR